MELLDHFQEFKILALFSSFSSFRFLLFIIPSISSSSSSSLSLFPCFVHPRGRNYPPPPPTRRMPQNGKLGQKRRGRKTKEGKRREEEEESGSNDDEEEDDHWGREEWRWMRWVDGMDHLSGNKPNYDGLFESFLKEENDQANYWSVPRILISKLLSHLIQNIELGISKVQVHFSSKLFR